jgi:putative transposase
MSRIARVVVEGIPHHVTQRGNGRQEVFCSEADYRLYLDLLRVYSLRFGLKVWAYCLMPNHVHLIAVPQRPLSLARTLGRTHSDYARHFNLGRRSCGHVWQARFFSCPLDGAHLWQAMAYVERNPVRAGLAAEATAYRWSSAGAHANGMEREGLLDLETWERQYTPGRWREVLETGVNEEALRERLWEATLRGRPLGGQEFVEELERRMRRRLRPLPTGRPRNRAGRGPQDAEAGQLALGIGV